MKHDKKRESGSVIARGSRMIWLCMLAVTLTTCVALPVSAATGRLITGNTPPYVSTAKNLGTVDASEIIEVTIWLNPHNRGELDQLAEQLYDRTSPNYRHWLTRTDLAARFMPTAAEAKTIEEFFAAHNMKVVRRGPDNFFVRASGTVGDIERAFGVQLNNYQVLGKTVRANDRDPYVEGAAGEFVMSVSGLDSGKYEHPMLARNAPSAIGSTAALDASTVQDASIFSSICFPGTVTNVFSTNNNGSLPIATYQGNVLNLQSLTSSGCAYTPPTIHTAYNLTGLYAEGYTGKGQTIGIIDWCGSLTIQSDANEFSAQFGLPALTSSNFAITYIPTPSTCEAADQVEINIDVEWAHAIAPGANINLIVPPSATFQDVDEAEVTAATYGLANVISGSYGAPESLVPASLLASGNLINEIAAVVGISANFSSGDGGDFSADGIPPTVSTPADSPWATAVGGITLALNPDNSIAWQAGWGNNVNLIAQEGFVADPAYEDDFFYAGSGGGPTNCATQIDNSKTGAITCIAGFPKPSFQKHVPGKYRQLPDISWLADPYTGVAILISVPGSVPLQVWQVWGGTSVACPMFSALWAIANQEAEAGRAAPLGLAASYVYSLPAGAVTDIVPVGSKSNITASIQDAKGTTAYDANAVMGGKAPAEFVSAVWDYAFTEETAAVVSFGTDCTAFTPPHNFVTPCTSPTSLHTNVGWDNVTGVGVPNGKVFADSFFKK